MLEFLTFLLIFVFGLGAVGQPPIDAAEILSRIEAQVGEAEEPQGDPVNSYQQGQAVAEEHTDLPDQANLDGLGSQTGTHPSTEGGEPGAQADGVEPNTDTAEAYNSSSGIVIGSVAQVAVDNAPPLLPCDDPDADCDSPDEPPVTPDPPLPCIPPPPCISTQPFCLLPEPAGGWCEPSEDTHPNPDPTPTGHPDKPPFECPPPPFSPYSLGPISPDVVVCIQQ